MKTSKKLNKLIALAVLLGGVTYSGSAWADPVPGPVDIIISSTGVDPNTYGGGSDANGIWGVTGAQTVGQDVINSIKTSGDVAKNVYGILSQSKSSDESFKMYSLSGGIDVKSTGGRAFDIYLSGTGTNTISGLGSITAETTSTKANYKSACGIYAYNTGSNIFSVGFADANGSISAYSASGGNYGIQFYQDSTGTSEVKNVKTITAGVATTGGSISSGIAYGIQAKAGVNTVIFTGAGSSITAKSGGSDAYGIYAEGTGKTYVSNLGSITAETSGSDKTAYGIYGQGSGESNISFVTSGGTIKATSITGSHRTAYGTYIREGQMTVSNIKSIEVNSVTATGICGTTDDKSEIGSESEYSFIATGGDITVSGSSGSTGIQVKKNSKMTVTNLKSITAEDSSTGNVRGIYSTDNAENNVSFVTSGGTINATAAGGNAYGINAIEQSKMTVENLGSITAETTSTTEDRKSAYGIYAKNGNAVSDNATFSVTMTNGSISVYSASGANHGIRFDNDSIGTSEVLNVKTITAGVSGSNVSIGMTYGISDAAGTNTVTFTGAGSSITAKSSGNMAFGILLTGTGAKTISGLGSITVERTDNTGDYKNAFGISTCNINTDEKKFSVSFDSTNGGSISVYSAEGDNYGITFNKDEGGNPIGTSEVNNVKSITAGVTKNDQGAEVISSGVAYGIYAAAGTNTVAFTGAGSSIIAKSSGEHAYGIYSKGSDVNFANNVSFVTSGGNIKATNATKDACGIRAEGTGTTTVSNIGSIEANCSKYAYGIYSKGSDASFKNNVTFVTSGGSINATSTTRVPYGIGAFGAGTTIVENLSSITAEGSNSTYGIYSSGEDASFANNVTFVTAGGTITATSTGDNAYGIFLINTGTMTVTNLGTITAETAGASKFAYGIYSKGSADTFANNVSFQGNGGQAITATNTTTAANAYSIYATEQGATTVTFESSVLSGKVKQDGSATLTLTFNNGGVWDVKKDDVSGTVTANVNNGGTIKFAGVNESYSGGNVHVIVSNGGTIDTRSRDDEGKVVTTGGTTKTVDLGSGTFNAQQGSKISLDALTKDNGLTMDQVKTTGIVGGTIALGSVNIKVATATTAWETAKNANIFVDGASQAQAGITIMGTTTTTTDNYVYTFTGGTSGSVSATSVLAEYKLPQVIQANPENAGKADAYSFDKGDITLEADLGTLNNTYRTSGKPEFTIFGNDHSLIANGKGGVTINTGDTLTVKNLTISGFDTFATNTGILNLTDVTFTGTTGTADVVNNATGEVNIAGTVVLDKGIANEGTVFVGDGAVLTGEVRGGGILEFKGNVDIDSPKVANNIKIDDGKKVSIGSATEAKTVEVTSNSIVINKEAELTVKSKDSGKVVMAENVTITGHENGVLRVTEGSFLEYNNTTEKTIKAQDNNTFTVIVEKDATLDPVVSVFAEGVNVQVDGGGTLVLQPGTLFANIHQDAGSVLKVAAEDIKTTALLSGVDKASQLDVSAGTLQLTGTVKLNDSFKLVEGAAVTNGTITMADMWHVQADGLNGLLAEFIMDKGVIGFEVRNVLTAVEANTSALAGVQQGAAAMVNQLTDKVAENLTLALRPAAEGKYDKQVWASYINSKETVDDRDFWNLKGSNTAKYRGAIVGADFYTSDKVIAGMAISYAKGDISANTIDSTHVQNDSKYYGVSFYDRVTNGPVALTYDIGYQYGKNDISMSARENITADVDTQSYTAGVRAERAYKVSKTSTFAPFVSLRYLKLHTKEYKNSNQAKFDANDQNLFIPKLGVAWHGDFVNAKSGWAFKPVAEIGYIFNIGNRSAESKYVTATSRAFNTEYDVVDSGTYYGKLGFRVAKKNFFIGADYNYQKGSTTKNSRWNVNLGWNF